MLECFKVHSGDVIDSKIPHHFETSVDVWNPSGNETPYVFRSKMCKEDGGSLFLPNIGFGLDGDKAYVYVIHHGKVGTDLSNDGRKLNRILIKQIRMFMMIILMKILRMFLYLVLLL